MEGKEHNVEYFPVRKKMLCPFCFKFDVLPIGESFISISLLGKQNELTEKAINTWLTHWKL